MKPRLKPVVRVLAVAFGGLSAAATMPASAQQQLDRVEITGSLIKRVEGESALPVVVISAEELERAGV